MQTLGTAETVVAPSELALGFGDFVWGRIQNYQWWPGQVSDPSKALDGSKKGQQSDEDSVLVSYFGSDSFAWCNPSQLKPFVECFDQIVNSSSSKSFRAALDLAIAEISKCLEAQLSCSCWPEEERSGIGKISNYSVEEFLGLVETVAVDRSAVNVLDIVMLRSWVSGFEGGIDTGHMRKMVSDLVDKIDLDFPVAEAIEEKEENEEALVSRSGVLKVPNRGRKKRSMAVLIAQMDMDSVEVSDGDEEKKEARKDLDSVEKEIKKDLEVREGDIGSGRRERKKSKYLSPPYTYLSGGAAAKSLVSPKRPKSLRAFPLEPSSIVVKCTTEGLHKEEEEKCGPLFEVDELDTREFLSELLSELRAAAANPLHLKWNRVANMVRGFFAEFRKVVNSNGANFDAYEKQLVESVGQDGKIVNPMVDDKCEDGKKTEGKGGKKRKDIVKDEGENLVDKSGEGKETEAKRGRKWKDVTNVEGEIQGDKPEDGKKSERKRRKKKKDAVNGEGETLGNGDESKDGKKPWKKSRRKKKDVVNGERETPGDKSEDGKISESKRGRKWKDVLNSDGETPIDKSGDGKKTLGRSGRNKKDKVDTEEETPIDLSQQRAKHLEENDNASSNVISGRKRGRKTADSIQNIIGVLSCETLINVELKETVQAQTKGEEVGNTRSTKKVTLRQKRMNNKDGPIIDVPVNLGSEIINGSGEKKSKRKNNKNSTAHEDPASILLTFSSEISLPSKEHLISTLGKYGSVIQSQTEILKESNSAKVVFVRSSDAEKAFNDKIAAFGLPIASCRLRYLTGNLSSPSSPTLIPVQRPPLPSIRKSLVRMISSLSGSAPETRDNLVGDMHGLLMKVDKLMTEPAVGNST